MTELLAVVAITLLAVISPGPDFAMVSRNGLLLSRRSGVLTALGIAAGVCVHVSYTLLGVGVLIQQSLWLFNLIKLAGAAYLVFLGIRMLRARPAVDEVMADQPALSSLGALRTGFLTNVLNPKTTIFIVSLFMQVVQPQTPLAVQLGYGAFIVLAHALWFSAVAIFFSNASVRAGLLAVRHWIDRVFGALLVGFGMLLALTQPSR
ncbi:LysE family transporter [Aeromonas sp. FDAARGOS 1409]|uniref:LysE family transporter n=1 Tax=Aeromonas TaxID=642 RepID=UPI001C24E320|nr:LysE family transporter [Aeromonas sp. FDAARGOS 1409]QXC30860.1 LysE family transporter [Aeromonas sp. FDAARGOS 1409]